MIPRRRIFSLFVILLSGLFCITPTESPGASQNRPVQSPERAADLVLLNGKIATMNPKQPQAEALAVRGDILVAVGSNAEIRKRIGPSTEVIDLAGKLAVPGFIEGHGHFVGLGQSKMMLDLTRVKNWDEIVAMVGEAAKKSQPGQWILGRGWHQEKWDRVPQPNVEGFPTHASLSRASPQNPVLLTHASGHAAFANLKAMELSGITRNTPNPSGGEILRDLSGEPTGMLRETAQGLVRQAQSDSRARLSARNREAEELRAIELATKECLSKGITSFQDAGSSFQTIDLLKRLARDGKLGIRMWVMIRVGNQELARKLPDYRIIDLGEKRLTVRAIKHAIDGALGSRGAWLLEPYSDAPDSTGLNTTPIPVIREAARLALKHDFQLCVHAIGDRANRETLNIFEEAFKDANGKDLRWRVEHAQHLHPDDIPRFARLGVIASMQGIHCTSDGPYVVKRLGEKRAREGAYVWQSLIRSGAVVTNGTDAPVEDVDPIACFYASVTRKLRDGSYFFPRERMSREQALRSYTLSTAYAAFEEKTKGSLEPGKLADITVLSKDILSIPQDEIAKARVVYTILGGKRAFTLKAQAE
ncbi:MAG TPA: amidohydrolase [Acidobacteriota bacterium]|nr:amidohydrolase [Acidobacteriota bacterium]